MVLLSNSAIDVLMNTILFIFFLPFFLFVSKVHSIIFHFPFFGRKISSILTLAEGKTKSRKKKKKKTEIALKSADYFADIFRSGVLNMFEADIINV